jgi:hypothetical protein
LVGNAKLTERPFDTGTTRNVAAIAGHIIRRDWPESVACLVADFLDRGPAFLVNGG